MSIGRGWAEYRDLSVASRSIISRSRGGVIDLRDTDKSRYFAITKFNNCFIIRSLNLFLKEYLQQAKRSAIFMQERSQEGESMVSFTHEQNSICSQKQLNDIAHEHTIICRQLFASHVVGSRPVKKKKHLHRMIIWIIFNFVWWAT